MYLHVIKICLTLLTWLVLLPRESRQSSTIFSFSTSGWTSLVWISCSVTLWRLLLFAPICRKMLLSSLDFSIKFVSQTVLFWCSLKGKWLTSSFPVLPVCFTGLKEKEIKSQYNKIFALYLSATLEEVGHFFFI